MPLADGVVVGLHEAATGTTDSFLRIPDRELLSATFAGSDEIDLQTFTTTENADGALQLEKTTAQFTDSSFTGDASNVGMGNSLVFPQLQTGPGKISTRDDSSIAIGVDGYVYAWGDNAAGQLGDGTTTMRTSPVRVLKGAQASSSAYLENIVYVSMGMTHALAVDGTGNVWAWGDGENGKLGRGSALDALTPIQVLKGAQASSSNFLEGIDQVAAGLETSFAVGDDVAWSWGNGYDGELGAGAVAAPANTAFPGKLWGTAAVSDGENIYTFGGSLDGVRTNAIFKYSPRDGLVVQVGSLPAALQQAGAVWAGSAAYVFGGNTASGELSTIYKFVPATGAVSTLSTPLSIARSRAAVLWDGSTAWIMGGSGGGGSRVEQFNPVTETMAVYGDTISGGRSQATAAWSGTFGYIFGGHDGTSWLSTISRLNTATGAVTNLGVQLPAKGLNSAVEINGIAYIFGGANGGGCFNTIYEFNMQAETGTTSALTLPRTSCATAAAQTASAVYIVGGATGLGGATHVDGIVEFKKAEATLLDATTHPQYFDQTTPVPVDGGEQGEGALTGLAGIAVGEYGAGAVAWTGGGLAYEWGGPRAVAEPEAVLNGLQGTSSGLLEGVEEVSAGAGHMVARLADGAVFSWGASGDDGEFGNGQTTGTATTSVPLMAVQQQAPQLLSTTLPGSRTWTSAIWDGSNAYIFGGEFTNANGGAGQTSIYKFNPGTGVVSTVSATLPAGRGETSAVWDGSNAYIFGGATSGSEVNTIYKFNPGTGVVSTVSATLPQNVAGSSAIWDGSNAYIFGGENTGGTELNTIYKFNPGTGAVSTVSATLPVGLKWTSAIWDGSNAYIFGGVDGGGAEKNTIYKFNPGTGVVSTVSATLPAALGATSAVWDGSNAYIFGGTVGSQKNTIYRFNPGMVAVSTVSPTLPDARASMSAVWDGSNAYIFGGSIGNAATNTIFKFADGRKATEIIQDNPAAAIIEGVQHIIVGVEDGTYFGSLRSYELAGGAWIKNDAVIGGLPTSTIEAAPEIFTLAGNTYMLLGSKTTCCVGYRWNEGTTAWVADSSIQQGPAGSLTSTFGSSTMYAKPAVFTISGATYLLVAKSDGTYTGFNWGGSNWVSDTQIKSGLPTSDSFAAPEVFDYEGSTYLVEQYNGGTKAFRWTGSTWVADTARATGLSAGNYRNLDAFAFNNQIIGIHGLGGTVQQIEGYQLTDGGWRLGKSFPVQVLAGEQGSGALSDIVQASASARGGTAIDGLGALYAWGLGTSGELGNGAAASSSTPVKVLRGAQPGAGTYLANAYFAIGGANHKIVATSSKQVYAFGSQTNGALGNLASAGTQSSPVKTEPGAMGGTYLLADVVSDTTSLTSGTYTSGVLAGVHAILGSSHTASTTGSATVTQQWRSGWSAAPDAFTWTAWATGLPEERKYYQYRYVFTKNVGAGSSASVDDVIVSYDDYAAAGTSTIQWTVPGGLQATDATLTVGESLPNDATLSYEIRPGTSGSFTAVEPGEVFTFGSPNAVIQVRATMASSWSTPLLQDVTITWNAAGESTFTGSTQRTSGSTSETDAASLTPTVSLGAASLAVPVSSSGSGIVSVLGETVVEDAGVDGFECSLVGTALPTIVTSPKGAGYGNGVSLDGVNRGLQSSGLVCGVPSGVPVTQYSIRAQGIKPAALGSKMVIAGRSDGTASGTQADLYITAGGAIAAEQATSGGSLVTVTGPTLTAGTTYEAQASWDGSTLRLFLNGAEVGTPQSITSIRQTAGLPPFVIGKNFAPSGSQATFNGQLDEVEWSRVARNTASYTAPSAPYVEDANTVGLWHMNSAPQLALSPVTSLVQVTSSTYFFDAASQFVYAGVWAYNGQAIERTVTAEYGAVFSLTVPKILESGDYFTASGTLTTASGGPVTNVLASASFYQAGALMFGPVTNYVSNGNVLITVSTNYIEPGEYDVTISYTDAGVTFSQNYELLISSGTETVQTGGTFQSYSNAIVHFSFFQQSTGLGLDPATLKVLASDQHAPTSLDRLMSNDKATTTGLELNYKVLDFWDNQIYPSGSSHASFVVNAKQMFVDVGLPLANFKVKNTNSSVVHMHVINNGVDVSQYVLPQEIVILNLVPATYEITLDYYNAQTGVYQETKEDEVEVTSDIFYWIRGYDLADIVINLDNGNTNLANQIINVGVNVNNQGTTIGTQITNLGATVNNVESNIGNQINALSLEVSNLNTEIGTQINAVEQSISNLNTEIGVQFNAVNVRLAEHDANLTELRGRLTENLTININRLGDALFNGTESLLDELGNLTDAFTSPHEIFVPAFTYGGLANDTLPPNSGLEVDASLTDTNAVVVRWFAKDNVIVKTTTLWYREQGDDWKVIGTYAASGGEKTVGGLEVGITYEFRSQAIDLAGNLERMPDDARQPGFKAFTLGGELAEQPPGDASALFTPAPIAAMLAGLLLALAAISRRRQA